MLKYNELSVAKINDNKNIVISECTKNENEPNGYTLAQQVEVTDGGKRIKVFMKGAIHIKDVDCLYNLRDAIIQAIDEIEEIKHFV
jgi:hypothetical protein